MIMHRTYHIIGALVFMLALLVQTFRNELVWLDYLINTQNYIASCENKNKPEMDCNGHCQMAKKMDSSQDQNTQAPQIQLKLSEVVLYSNESLSLTAPSCALIKKRYPELFVPGLKQFAATFFHPPAIKG